MISDIIYVFVFWFVIITIISGLCLVISLGVYLHDVMKVEKKKRKHYCKGGK